MNILLDTCSFLWLVKRSEALSVNAVDALVEPEDEVYLSAVSAWEISVKYRFGKLPLPILPGQFVPKERARHLIAPLDLSERDTLHLHKLPSPHKDPFDRMLVCQDIEHSMTLLTPDPLIMQYPIRCLWRRVTRVSHRPSRVRGSHIARLMQDVCFARASRPG